MLRAAHALLHDARRCWRCRRWGMGRGVISRAWRIQWCAPRSARRAWHVRASARRLGRALGTTGGICFRGVKRFLVPTLVYVVCLSWHFLVRRRADSIVCTLVRDARCAAVESRCEEICEEAQQTDRPTHARSKQQRPTYDVIATSSRKKREDSHTKGQHREGQGGALASHHRRLEASRVALQIKHVAPWTCNATRTLGALVTAMSL